MNQWAFVLAAYGVVVVATLALILLSWAAMRRAEADAEAVRRR
jgi:hypothetical protein